ncbi:MAG TPA: family 1 encapsulin nanocompartment shell protein [Streptosporangiaceae bacterium]|nr:family 1 encapsulin nanocompartment shell protein [Streptosporangiaceae bacterium]
MDNLYRELAPVSDAAWAEIEEEAARTLRRHMAGRKVVDLHGPEGTDFSAVGTGHVSDVAAPADGVLAKQRAVLPVTEFRVPFAVDRNAIDDVERGAQDSDWQPVKDAARQIAFAEDRAIFEGYQDGGIEGIRAAASNPSMTLPADVLEYPAAIAEALRHLRVAGVNGPYSVLLSADAYTAVNETSDHGYPILEHINRIVDGDIVWAPAIDGAFVLTTRGGDFGLYLGQDASIGYLSHDENRVRLYLQESLTFLVATAEAAVALAPASGRRGGRR